MLFKHLIQEDAKAAFFKNIIIKTILRKPVF